MESGEEAPWFKCIMTYFDDRSAHRGPKELLKSGRQEGRGGGQHPLQWAPTTMSGRIWRNPLPSRHLASWFHLTLIPLPSSLWLPPSRWILSPFRDAAVYPAAALPSLAASSQRVCPVQHPSLASGVTLSQCNHCGNAAHETGLWKLLRENWIRPFAFSF